MSPLDETQLRNMIREYARGQDGYDARLYDLWDKWNREHFEGLMVPALIQLTDPGQTHRYGCCTTSSGLAGIRSAIKIRRSILGGTPLGLKHGNRNPEGCRRFLEDVLLHEMIHQYHHEVTGEADRSYSGHGPAFSAKANEIGKKLGLPSVRRTCKSRDGRDPSPSQWPHDVRDEAHYLGAYVPASRDEPESISVPLGDIDGAVVVLSRHFDRDELCGRLMALGESRASPARIVSYESGEPYDIYIGRGKRGTGLKKSDWHNPFKVDKDGTREEVVQKFEAYLTQERPDLIARLPELKGKTLACHCAPEPCHGDVLVRLVGELA